MLVDSYALEDAVIESGITDEMLSALDDVGVVGLGVLADGLRKPIGVAGPIVGPRDWQGISFGTVMSDGQAEAIRALGATPVQISDPGREDAFDEGAIQGFEFNLHNYQRDPKLTHLAPYVTSNVNLWPQMDVLFAGPARLAALTSEQRGWLEEAARDAETESAALADEDTQAVESSCAAGARFVQASRTDLAALRQGFVPVYTGLQRDPSTKAFIEQIQTLKRSTPAKPEPVIPPGCTGPAPEQPSTRMGRAPAYLNGTYRYEITPERGPQGRHGGSRGPLSAGQHVDAPRWALFQPMGSHRDVLGGRETDHL